MSFITYTKPEKETNYTTVIYTVQIPFLIANGIFLNFVVKIFKVCYKISENRYRLLISPIKFFSTRSMVDKYLGKLTFNLT